MTEPGCGCRDQAPVATTEDAFLGDMLRIRQPSRGYRAGVDAVLLAATVDLEPGQLATVIDCGAGVGTVGLCVAVRCREAKVTLVEREAALIAIAGENVARNGLDDRVRVVAGDITARGAAAPQIAADSFDVVLANPPFHDADGGTPAGDLLKQASHAMDPDLIDDWARFAARVAKPGGRLTMIHKPAALPMLLAALRDRFGAITLRPVHSHAGRPAIRVIVSAIKGSRAELQIRPGLVLHEAGGGFTPYVSRILRQGAGLNDHSSTSVFSDPAKD
jgi:tRNA1(Val) A37 N6-methylase TrmN6